MVRRMVRGWARQFWKYRQHQVEDVEQECFKKWIPARRQLPDQSKPHLAPLLAATINSVLTDTTRYHLAQKRAGAEQSEDIDDHANDMPGIAQDDDLRIMVRSIIDQLPALQQRICHLRMTDHTFEEIRGILHISRRRFDNEWRLILNEFRKAGIDHP